jgi:hypothetical protein
VFTGVLALVAFALVVPRLTAPLATAPPAPSVEAGESDARDLRTPLPEELHARWRTQSTPPEVAVGEVVDVTLQFVNTGNVPWIRGTPSEIRLGEVGARPIPAEMRVDWPLPNRPAIQREAIVYEDTVATFSFKVAAVAPGTFRLQLRPVVDGVAWLEDEGVYVDIVVRS